jgi:hypothetical protein
MKKLLFITFLALAVLIAGCAPQAPRSAYPAPAAPQPQYAPQYEPLPPQPSQQPATAPSMRYSSEHSLSPNAPNSGVQRTVGGFVGKLITGSYAPLLEYTRQDYANAIIVGRAVVLYFDSGDCTPEFSAMQAVFAGLTTDKVIGFRVWTNSKADADSRIIAKQLSVTTPCTKAILVQGKVVQKSPDAWDKQRFQNEINDIVS